MPKFRNAALAATTAIALTFSGTTVAVAEDTEDTNQSSAAFASLSSGHSSQLGDATNADETITGNDALGKTTDFGDAEWAEIWANLTKVLGIGTVIGGIIAAVNSVRYITGR